MRFVYRLDIEYDGTEFFGWQIQRKERTVQGELRRALEILLKTDQFGLVGASRTDAGVHAENQVASLHLDRPIEDLGRFLRSLNGILPPDVAVKAITPAPSDFHARFSARGKRYRYRIALRKTALMRRFAWELQGWSPDPTLLEEMARSLIGEQDLRYLALEVDPQGSGKTVIRDAAWRREGDFYLFEIEGIRFFHKTVRILVGLMVRIASGKLPLEVLDRALKLKEKPPMFVAPAKGLTLVEVLY